MIDLISEMIIEIYDTVIERYGGLSDIPCLGTIDYTVAKINDEPAHPHMPRALPRVRGPPARGCNHRALSAIISSSKAICSQP
ncbi:MAG: hypothetical protein AB9879_06965 [Methanothrix sp.]